MRRFHIVWVQSALVCEFLPSEINLPSPLHTQTKISRTCFDLDFLLRWSSLVFLLLFLLLFSFHSCFLVSFSLSLLPPFMFSCFSFSSCFHVVLFPLILFCSLPIEKHNVINGKIPCPSFPLLAPPPSLSQYPWALSLWEKSTIFSLVTDREIVTLFLCLANLRSDLVSMTHLMSCCSMLMEWPLQWLTTLVRCCCAFWYND